jgi:hypothetical protein
MNLLSTLVATAAAVVVFVTSVADAANNFEVPVPTIVYHDQPVDHFNAADKRTFKEQVLVYGAYFKAAGSKPDAPVFLICGGEGPVRGGYDHDGIGRRCECSCDVHLFSLRSEQYANLTIYTKLRFYRV